MQKLIKCIYFTEEQIKWDKNMETGEFVGIIEGGKRTYGYTYTKQKK